MLAPFDGRVCELLRHRPVEAARVPARDHGAVQVDLERQVVGPVALDAKVWQRLRLLRRCGDAAILEQRQRRHPRGDRRGEALAEERPERDVLPGLDVAGAPVVDEHDAEDVICERARRHRLGLRARHADDEAELELDVEASRRAVDGRVRVRRLRLAPRPADRRAADDDRSGPAVVADRQVTPVRQQRLRVGPEHPAEVRRVLERGVEVDVVRDGERQLRRHLVERDRVARSGRRERLLGRALPGVPPLRQQLVERALAQVDDGVAGAEPEVRGPAAHEGAEPLRHRTPSRFRSSTGSEKEQLPTATSCSRRTRSSSSAPATRSRQRRPAGPSSTARSTPRHRRTRRLRSR